MNELNVLTSNGRFENVRSICGFIADAAEKCGIDESTRFQIELACDEACTNVIEHAYGGEDKGDIEASWQVEKGYFVITIRDNGSPFDPTPGVTPNETVNGSNSAEKDLKVGGLGLHFMHKLMDEVKFSFDRERGNILVMKKHIPTEKAS